MGDTVLWTMSADVWAESRRASHTMSPTGTMNANAYIADPYGTSLPTMSRTSTYWETRLAGAITVAEATTVLSSSGCFTCTRMATSTLAVYMHPTRNIPRGEMVTGYDSMLRVAVGTVAVGKAVGMPVGTAVGTIVGCADGDKVVPQPNTPR